PPPTLPRPSSHFNLFTLSKKKSVHESSSRPCPSHPFNCLRVTSLPPYESYRTSLSLPPSPFIVPYLKMPELHKAGVAMALAIAHFFYQSSGLTKFYNELYAYWKCTPLLVLISFVALHGGGVPLKTRGLLVLALTAGCAGDYVIGISKEGIVPGAIAFGIGHIFYMLTFVPETISICWPLAAVLGVWNALVGYYCLLPVLKVSVIAVLVMTIYSFILTSTVIYSASQCLYGSTVHPPFADGLKWRLLGFALFYVSDNIFIMEHTGYRIPLAEHWILFTYFAAQYILVRAAVQCEKYKPKSKSS
ncbi:hypothetical protein PRIPAC_87654, partial [Pristionchus pacificus]